MNFETRHIGHSPVRASKIIELTVTNWSGDNSMTEDVTDLSGKVDKKLIVELRELADELENQNRLIAEQDPQNK